MSGYGLSPFGIGVFGSDTPAAASQTSGQIVSSRRFDASGNPVQTSDGTGAFEAMSDALQRARNLLLRSRPRTKFITATFATDEDKRCRDALAILTKAPSPLIEIVKVAVETSGSRGRTDVRVRDLTDGGREVVINASPRFY